MQMAPLCIGKVVVGVNCKTEMASIPTTKKELAEKQKCRADRLLCFKARSCKTSCCGLFCPINLWCACARCSLTLAVHACTHDDPSAHLHGASAPLHAVRASVRSQLGWRSPSSRSFLCRMALHGRNPAGAADSGMQAPRLAS